jgi:hypothetical protein
MRAKAVVMLLLVLWMIKQEARSYDSHFSKKIYPIINDE